MSTQQNKKIYVSDIMLSLDKFPVILEKVIFKEALEEMNHFRLGIACIIDENTKLIGVLTDGDIRRKLLKVQKPFSAFFIDDAITHSIKSPITTYSEDTLENSIKIMDEKQIWDLPVINKDGTLVGLLHLHPAVKALLNTLV